MIKKVIINESQYLNLFKQSSVSLNETYNNLTFGEFDSQMKKMGFTRRNASGGGSGKIYSLPSGPKVTVHAHGDSDRIPADALEQVKIELEKIGWFNNIRNFKIFPFKKWDIKAKSIKRDTTKEDIKKANEKYKDAELKRAFVNTDNPLCTLKTAEGVNLCRSVNDRRPLLDTWFDDYGYDKVNGLPCLKRNNWETIETECYPINQDGTLDTNNIIIENKKHGKKRIS